MPKKGKLSGAIKEAKFIKALVDSGGNATEAYKATVPKIKANSAGEMGSRTLKRIDPEDINALYEKIGCTKDTVLADLFKRMATATNPEFAQFTNILAKIGGWDKQTGNLQDILSRDLDLIEVVKIRLKKRSNANDLRQVIDVDNTLVNNKSNDIATENNISDEQGK